MYKTNFLTNRLLLPDPVTYDDDDEDDGDDDDDDDC